LEPFALAGVLAHHLGVDAEREASVGMAELCHDLRSAAMPAHQPLDPAAPDQLAVPKQRLPHPPGSVGEIVGRVQLPDAAEQPLVLDLAG